ncbi:hypothetical protein GGI43DRAFT_6461 [Trichoderma evansii]
MCLFDPRPWTLPVPFVGMVVRCFIGLIMLANMNGLYERLRILDVSPVYIFVMNISLLASILLLIGAFCAMRLNNYFCSPNMKMLCLGLASIWALVFVFNASIIVSGFVHCHAPGYQEEVAQQYCHFFGNRKAAEIPDWEGTSWSVYYWISTALALYMACWQTISWFTRFLMVKKIIQRGENSAMNGA